MKRYRLLSLLLALCLVCALLPLSVGAADCIEVSSAAEMAQRLADTPARPMSRGGDTQETMRVLVLEPALPDTCGAQRVLHYAAYDEFLLEYPDRAQAEAAFETLTEVYGLRHCWLDTPEQSAHVMDGAVPMAATTWGADYMHLTSYRNEVHTRAHFDEAQTVVAIIDSGVDPENTALTARSWMSYDFVNGSSAFSEVAGDNIARGHGTRVASILDSVLPQNVRFMYLRVFNDNGQADRDTVLTALQYAIENGASVVNLSLGWEDDYNGTFDFLDSAMQRAVSRGVVLVCAAGNKHKDVEISYPANSKYTIAVSAVNSRMEYVVYSNYGEGVDFCAPGSDITATTVGGSVVNCAGTSFSAPHITAAAAELKILEPAATTQRIYSLLRTYAKDLGISGKDNIYGWGIPVLPSSYPGTTDHIWDMGRVTRPATVKTAGTRVYTCRACGAERTETIPPTEGRVDSGFADVPRTEYYAAPVAWAAVNGITTGTDSTHFSPNQVCTRAQVVTFLWRAAGSPQPKTTLNPFSDVSRNEYYYNAVLWAVENDITNGTSLLTFSPEAPCTRAHVVTFLRRFDRAAGGETPAGAGRTDANAFTDVPAGAYYADAVDWAVANGITNGMTPTTFGPDAGCTRAHVVTFLYRCMNRGELQ